MKKSAQKMNQRKQVKIMDWVLQEEEEDFLMDKTPIELSDILEEEE